MIVVTAAAVTLAACSTTVKETPAPGGMPANTATTLSVRNVTGSSTAAKAPAEAVGSLAEAIRIDLAGAPGSGPPADLSFVISDYRVVGNAARFMVGALAGANKMTVDVTLKSPSGATLRQFQVTRSANTMGVGAFMNQKGSLVSQTAEGIVKAVRGEK
jgi:uncharacterized lipoprotein YmbA